MRALKNIIYIVLFISLFANTTELIAQGTESFTNIPTSSSSYLLREWTDDNGKAWKATNASTNQTITGKAIFIKEGVLTGNLSPAQQVAGVGYISFKYKIPFSDASRKVTITIKVGSTTKTIINAQALIQNDIYTVNNFLVNLSGDSIIMTVSSDAAGARVAIDDISWTAYQTIPTLQVSPNALIDFSYIYGNGPSTEKSFTLEGSNLTNNVSLTAPTNYEISLTSASGFTNSLSIAPVSGSVNKTIYVRLKAGLVIGTYNSENITITSNGATSLNLSCSGEVLSNCVLVQNFDFCNSTGGNDGLWEGNIATTQLSSLSGWDLTKVYNANKCVKVGSASQKGLITTQNFGVAGNYILTFKAGAWAGDKTTLNIEILNGGTISASTVTMINGAFSSYSLTINAATANSRIRFSGQQASKSRFFLDDISICPNDNPLLEASVATLEDFDYVYGDGPSAEQSFTLEGSNLINNITLTAPTNYEISLTSTSGFTNSLSIAPVSGLINKTIYVRLKAGLSINSYNENLTITSSGVPNINVSLLGTVHISAVSSLKINCTTNSTATISWENPTDAFDGVVIGIRNDANLPHSLSSNLPSSLNANTVFGLGTEYGTTTPKSYVVYKGTGTSVEITGLTAGDTYKIRAYTYKNETYNLLDDCPTLSINNLSITEVQSVVTANGNMRAEIAWANPNLGCFDEVMIICREAASITTIPSGNGSAYVANQNFGDPGSQIGSTGEYVVYKNTGTSINILSLTNGVHYFAKIFVRMGTQWSSGVEVEVVPIENSNFLLGDLAIVSVNTNLAIPITGDDEISFVIFKTLKQDNAIDLTDNGYGRVYEGYWGTGEGVIRMKRKNSDLAAGTIITIVGQQKNLSPNLGYNVYLANNVIDNANWEITSLSGTEVFNLNKNDQVWFLQGGTWTKHDANKASYSGNVLYGWTAIGWKSVPGWLDGTKGSMIYPDCSCANTSVVVSGSVDKVRYIGSIDPGTRSEWIGRINDQENWVSYADNSAFDASPRNYKTGNFSFTVLPGELTTGLWSGYKSSQWCDCANWMNLKVPTETIDVTIPILSNPNCNEVVISNHIDSISQCKTLVINGVLLAKDNAPLIVKSHLTIDGGTFNSDNKKINLQVGGNLVIDNINNFNSANVDLTLNGSNQSINAEGALNKDIKFNNLLLSNGGIKTIEDSISLNNLTIQSSTTLAVGTNKILLSKSLVNNGNMTFAAGSKFVFNGLTKQTISGSSTSNFYDVLLSNAAGIDLQSSIGVTNILDLGSDVLTEGIINSGSASAKVIIRNGASIINYGANHFINGRITKIGSSNFVFPTGYVSGTNKFYGKFSATPVEGTATTEMSAEYRFTRVGMPDWWEHGGNMETGVGKFHHVSDREYWLVNSDKNLGSVTIYWIDQAGANATNSIHSFDDDFTTHIGIACYHENKWKNLGESVNGNFESGYISATKYIPAGAKAPGDKFVSFGSKKSPDLILPIRLLDFYAECNNANAILHWTTASEQNNDYFVIEKSNNAKDFHELSRIKGAGNSSSEISYSVLDSKLLTGSSYYRLKQVDYDGKSTTSDIIWVNCDKFEKQSVDIYPNPFDNKLNLVFNNYSGSIATIEIFNQIGSLVLTKKVYLEEDNKISMNLNDLESGVYVLKIKSNTLNYISKIVKQ